MFLNRTAAWLTWNFAGGRNDINEIVLFCGHCEKAGFFGKDDSAGKMEHRRKRERLNLRWIDFMKEAIGMSFRSWAELLEQDSVDITHLPDCQELNQIQQHVSTRAHVRTHTHTDDDREKVDVQFSLILWERIIFSSSDIWTIFRQSRSTPSRVRWGVFKKTITSSKFFSASLSQ